VSALWPVAELDRERIWFELSEKVHPLAFERIGASLNEINHFPLQVKSAPLMAFWFFLDSMRIANQANRDGMHANALIATRQCLEAISVIEVGLSTHEEAAAVLGRWDHDDETPGGLRKWLSISAWPTYGKGLWSEPWTEFMGKLAKAVQPYAHYSSQLAQWQTRLHMATTQDADVGFQAIVEFSPRAYDAQKATRITLFHVLMAYALGRVWLATIGHNDAEFAALLEELRAALGNSRYLDGHSTNWDQQFWPFVFFKSGSLTNLPS
jgi:hypothetical protein